MRDHVLLTLRGGSRVSLRHCRKSCRASSSLPIAARACPRRIHASPYVGISAMVALKSSTAPCSGAVRLQKSCNLLACPASADLCLLHMTSLPYDDRDSLTQSALHEG